MDAKNENPRKNPTNIERTSDRELVITRTVNGPARFVYEAWTKAELFKQWWVPKSAPMTLVSCEMDVRVGGSYRLEFSFGGPEAMAFHGKYLEVIPNSRIVWTNEEAGEGGQISTVTFEEKDGKTVVAMHELFPTKEALDTAMAEGSLSGTPETFDQLDEFVQSQL
jgi:uncharacterized protein YndB with AHSA1/START domain